MKYSAFANREVKRATTRDESWDAIRARLAKPVVIADKTAVGLFCGCTFGGSGERVRQNALEVSLLALDIDNKTPVLDEDGKPVKDPKTKKVVFRMVDDPIDTDIVAAVLEGFEHVIVTSHSHKPEWPKFRVVLPLAKPIAADDWPVFSQAAVKHLGLEAFLYGIDPVFFTNVAQLYYWPSHVKGAEHLFIHGTGQVLDVPAAAIAEQQETQDAQQAETKAKFAQKSGTREPFAEWQVRAFYAAEYPSLDQDRANGHGDWQGVCPFHNPDGEGSLKFHVHSVTGLYRCWSECNLTDEATAKGDLYAFYMRKHDCDFKTAKKAIVDLVGEPGAQYTHDELMAVIEVADAEDVEDLIAEIAKHPAKKRNELKRQLITMHPELPLEDLDKRVESHRKVTQFPKSAPPSNWEQDFEGQRQYQQERFGLDLAADRYQITESGIWEMRYPQRANAPQIPERAPKPLTDRPIWPMLMGDDLATGMVWVKLGWVGSRNVPHEAWHPATVLNSKEGLLTLNDAPVAVDNAIGVCGFLRYAKTAVTTEFKQVTSEVGWYGPEEEQRFVLPGDEVYEYIGAEFPSKGTVAGWAEGLERMLTLGKPGYVALCVLGLSAAAPFVRLIDKRNPIVALVHESNGGKGTVIEYALSIWSTRKTLVVPALSTGKGAQDRAVKRPDLPVFVDEVQQTLKLGAQAVEDLVYFLANGQRRVVSTRNGLSKGGERRCGVSFLAAEHEIMRSLQRGAQNRVVEIDGSPLPPNSPALSTLLQSKATHHPGAVGIELAKLFNAEGVLHLAMIEDGAQTLREAHGNALRGDDAYTVALMIEGLRMLEEVTGHAIPAEEVGAWFVTHLTGIRDATRDAEEECFINLLETVLSMEWAKEHSNNALMDHDGWIAWRRGLAGAPAEAPLEILPTHPKIVGLLRQRGFTEAIARQWCKKNWLQPQAKNLKWPRPATAKEGPGARVWRITPEGLALLALDPQFESYELELEVSP